jgi:beta-glucosidase/6-phospho-beta-glucosidase/beta-galactosidase
VKKHLTEEKGWAPAQMLKNEPKYAEYVQKKLHEKIDKLPVFESKYINVQFAIIM